MCTQTAKLAIFIFVAGKPLHSISQVDCKRTYLPGALPAKSLKLSSGSTNKKPHFITVDKRNSFLPQWRAPPLRSTPRPTPRPMAVPRCRSSTWFSFNKKHHISWCFGGFLSDHQNRSITTVITRLTYSSALPGGCWMLNVRFWEDLGGGPARVMICPKFGKICFSQATLATACLPNLIGLGNYI